MEDQEQFFNAPEQEGVVEPPSDNDEELIPVKVRDSVRESIKRASQSAQENRQLLAAYQAPQEEQAPPSKTWAKGFKFKMPAQHRRAPRPAPDDLTDNEKHWAAMAHGSALVTIAVGIATGGVGSLLTLFIPMAIYFYFRQKSEYVARHALQAFAAQVVGIVGFVILFTVMLTAWLVLLFISLIMVLVLIGILLLPVVAIVGAMALLATFALPFGMLVYSMIAAVESLNGHNYSYPWIGDWVDEQLYGSMESL